MSNNIYSNCIECETKFIESQRRRSFCSPSCRIEYCNKERFCPYCNSKLEVLNKNLKIEQLLTPKFCNANCASKYNASKQSLTWKLKSTEDMQNRRNNHVKTLIKNYGSIKNYQEQQTRKSVATCILRYGVENPMQHREFYKKQSSNIKFDMNIDFMIDTNDDWFSTPFSSIINNCMNYKEY